MKKSFKSVLSIVIKSIKDFNNKTKAIRLTYVVMFLWIILGCAGIYYKADLPSLGAYYASLALFVGTYLWGEYKRPAGSTNVLVKGKNSTREVMIYLVILLWCVMGCYGIVKTANFNDLAVYFSSLSPFVGSFIIYKTSANDSNNNGLDDDYSNIVPKK